MAGIDSNTKLMLHCNGTNSSTTIIDSSLSPHSVTAHGTAQLDTSTKKFGMASLYLDGDSDYLTLLDSSDWDVCGSLSDDWTIDFWINHTNLVGSQRYVTQDNGDANNRWSLYHDSTNGLLFEMYDNGNAKAFISENAVSMTTGVFNHVAFIKVGSTLGIYLNGVQKAYGTLSGVKTFTEDLYIGRFGYITSGYLNRNLDEFRIQQSNYFNASPNSGKTDTITVPTQEYKKTPSVMIFDPIDGSVAESKADSVTEDVSTADSKAVSAGTVASTADSKADSAGTAASTADSKADSAGTVASTADSKADSAGTAASTADSKADSVADEASTADSKADSAGTVASTADSKADSAGTAASTADSKADSVADEASTADSKAVSAGTVASTAESKADSLATVTESVIGSEPDAGEYKITDMQLDENGSLLVEYDDSAIGS